MPLERLDKILSGQNIASRKETKELVRRGLVSADGRTVQRADEKFDPEKTIITVEGKTVAYKKYLYIMLNKPRGILSASRDRHTPTVVDLLPQELKREGLFPAGRLDKDTEGFILITDDGELAHRMLAPKSHVFKLYEAVCDRPLTQTDVTLFAQGIVCGDEKYLPAKMKITGEKTALVEICEGKFHQVRKMFHAVGTEVLRLKRLRIGEVYLDPTLGSGKCRELNSDEIIKIISQKNEL